MLGIICIIYYGVVTWHKVLNWTDAFYRIKVSIYSDGRTLGRLAVIFKGWKRCSIGCGLEVADHIDHSLLISPLLDQVLLFDGRLLRLINFSHLRQFEIGCLSRFCIEARLITFEWPCACMGSKGFFKCFLIDHLVMLIFKDDSGACLDLSWLARFHFWLPTDGSIWVVQTSLHSFTYRWSLAWALFGHCRLSEWRQRLWVVSAFQIAKSFQVLAVRQVILSVTVFEIWRWPNLFIVVALLNLIVCWCYVSASKFRAALAELGFFI